MPVQYARVSTSFDESVDNVWWVYIQKQLIYSYQGFALLPFRQIIWVTLDETSALDVITLYRPIFLINSDRDNGAFNVFSIFGRLLWHPFVFSLVTGNFKRYLTAPCSSSISSLWVIPFDFQSSPQHQFNVHIRRRKTTSRSRFRPQPLSPRHNRLRRMLGLRILWKMIEGLIDAATTWV